MDFYLQEAAMEFFQWDDTLSVGVEEIDDQHKQLVQMINDVASAVANEHPEDAQQNVLYDMVVYAGVHFSTEEKHMQYLAYPDFAQHKARHHEYILKIAHFRKDFQAGKTSLTQDILNFLKDWLKNHIKITDKKLGTYLNQKGLK